jgi:hypothetical protein
MKSRSVDESLLNKNLQVVIIMQYLSAEGSARIGEEIDTIEMAIGFQRIAMQKTEEMEVLSGHLVCDNIPLPHEESQGTSAHKTVEKPDHQHRPPSRQPALVMREIPLLKIPAALQCGIKEKGGKVYRIGIVRSHWNHYTIKIRCNTKKAAEHYDQSRIPDLTNTTGSSMCGDGP